MVLSTPAREPQQERSRTTRRRLLEASVACIGELGWSGTTVAVVAQRAGVSRGAAQHHFRTREDLVTAAVEYLGEVQLTQLRERVDELPPGESRIEAVVDMLLNLYTGPMFRAALHLWVAASTDDALRAALVPLEARVGREAHRVALELLGVSEDQRGVREMVQATLDLARGLGLANLLSDDSRRRERIIHQWAGVLDSTLPEPGSAEPGDATRKISGAAR
ncbi:DNA-binding transcriptional regulator, AcrR family [Amycolatopsis sacchari]|uniref:DNA-binding transcriptional regulator, AcrR family n=1 Tax=Amycolatopsis sacchari TaxID=115433 RepID=A0A1I3K0E2_9PSEU|nr:TetR family transcriptional regulator [Amycolatopsis sacchari]SFI65923.1 DNA-binding transcriptional regulator, AcrR family [Amycolatopsis sacchari]